MSESVCQLLQTLFNFNVFKIGDFKLKSGLYSPIYIDLRILISTPTILRQTTNTLINLLQQNNVTFDYIVGVPYAALPLATLLCDRLDAPMLMTRKEPKAYGAKKQIEGIYESGKHCLIVEDVITTGSSILETIQILEKEGLTVTTVLAVINRQQGGAEALAERGITLHCPITMTSLIDYLISKNAITDHQRQMLLDQLIVTKCSISPLLCSNSWKLSDRQSTTINPLTKRLFEIMLTKCTNLCVALDYTHQQDILDMADQIGSSICALKLHADIIDDYSIEFIDKLKRLAETKNFLIIEDRKLADIGHTVQLQLTGGIHRIATWADAVTVHGLPGRSVLQGVESAMASKESVLSGCLLISELSTAGALTSSDEYRKGVWKMAQQHLASITGFICQHRCSDDPRFVYITPGVHLDQSSDTQGQQWRTPYQAIAIDGNDIVIVGRGITSAIDVFSTANRYRLASWDALCSRE